MSARAWQVPLQWPQAVENRAANAGAARGERLLKTGIVLALLALTVFDRFGLRLAGDYPIPPALIALYVLVALIAVTGSAVLNLRAALAYLAVASIAALSYLVNSNLGATQYVSVDSFLLMAVLYAPLAVSLREHTVSPALWGWIVKLFIGFSLVLAIAGIAQFFAQFAYRPEWLFDYTRLIPAPIRGAEIWHTVNPAETWIKSNGFFLREPSGFSFMMAFALLLELASSRRKWIMALFAAALVLTYSGSGLLALAIALLFPLRGGSVAQIVAALVLAVLVFLLLGEALNLTYTLNRLDEFDSQHSSAYCRFVEPGLAVFQGIDSNLWASLLGHGPGSLERMHNTCQTTFGKVPFEYGLTGALALGMLFLNALNRSASPIRIRIALAALWLLLGGPLVPEPLLMVYLISAMWPEGTAARATEREPVRA